MAKIGSWLRRGLEYFLDKPFFRLTRLFVARIFESDGEPGAEQLDFGIGLILTLLALPGTLVSILLFDKYSTLLQFFRGTGNFNPYNEALPDEYFFIVLSMVVTGAVAIWWWDAIFLDRRDYVNLVPLPLSLVKIFSADLAAVMFLAILFALDVNLASSILFPVAASATLQSISEVFAFAAVHAVVVTMASLFSFFSVFAVVGTLMVTLPYPVFRRISLTVRVLMLMGMLGLLSTSFAVPEAVAHLSLHPNSIVRLLPPVWFLGLCQGLRQSADPALAALGRVSWLALGIAFALTLTTWTLGYRRIFARISTTAEVSSGRTNRLVTAALSVLDRTLLDTPLQRAGYKFVVWTLLRNQRLGLVLGGFTGLGVVIASQTAFRAVRGTGLPSAEILSIPLILSFWALIGLRTVFEVPVEIRANWIFKLLSDPGAADVVPLARKLMLTFAVASAVGGVLPAYVWFWGFAIGAAHTVVVISACVLLTEIRLLQFRKIPFTCPYPPFRDSAVVSVLLCFFGFLSYTLIISNLEHWMFADFRRLLVIPVMCGLAWYGLHRFKNEVGGSESLTFEDAPVSFELLKLNDGN